MDIEQAKAIRSSSNWETIQKELDSWIYAEMQKMKTCSEGDLIRIQTTISAFEKVKNLPTVVIEREE